MDLVSIDKKLEDLREKYKRTTGIDRKIIEARGKLLVWAKEKYFQKQRSLHESWVN